MTIKDIMKIGTKGMSAIEREQEQERRIKVSERINLLQVKIVGCEAEAKKAAKGSSDEKRLKGKIRGYNREISKIKGDESVWLREAAWFLYA